MTKTCVDPAHPLLLGLLALILTGLLAGCGGAASGSDDGRVSVVATTNIVSDLALVIGGDAVTVSALMGPGVDPHLYKASAGDVRVLREADLILYNGIELEGKLSDLLGELGNSRPTLAVAEAIPEQQLLSVGRGKFDPHVWFSVPLWKQAAAATLEALVEVDPDRATDYRERLNDYLAELDALDAEVRSLVDAVPQEQRVLVTSHDAFGYFGEEYGFEVVAIQGTSTATEATTTDIERVAAVIAKRKLPAVFVESSVPRQTIDAVLASAKAGGTTSRVGGQLYGDAAGPEGTPEGTYLGMVRSNMTTISEALR